MIEYPVGLRSAQAGTVDFRNRCSRNPGSRSDEQDLISGIDHAVWQVSDLDRCIEVMVERLGFPLLRSVTDAGDLRLAEVDCGGLVVKLLENSSRRDPSFQGTLMVIAFESGTRLARAADILRQRGLSPGGIHVATQAGSGAQQPSPEFRFSLIRGVAQPEQTRLDAAVVLVERASAFAAEQRATAFERSGIRYAGVMGVDRLTAEVEDEFGFARWRRFLGSRYNAVLRQAEFSAGPCLQVVPGSQDRLSSMTIQCHDLRAVARHVRACGVASYCCRGGILLVPADTGGIALRFTGATGLAA